jgi:hypothetical protein
VPPNVPVTRPAEGVIIGYFQVTQLQSMPTVDAIASPAVVMLPDHRPVELAVLVVAAAVELHVKQAAELNVAHQQPMLRSCSSRADGSSFSLHGRFTCAHGERTGRVATAVEAGPCPLLRPVWAYVAPATLVSATWGVVLRARWKQR